MNEGAAAMPLAPQGGPAGPVGRDELSEGLMLVRASTIKVVRLQLAMERRDRRAVLETVDDLVVLDGRIRDFLKKMPAEAPGGPTPGELDEQLGALTREKWALTAGIGGKAARERVWIAPPVRVEDAPAKAVRERVGEDPLAWLGSPQEMEEATPLRLGRMMVPALFALLAVTGLALLLFAQTEAGEALIEHLMRRG